jgi:multiple sugar transport system permease protein
MSDKALSNAATDWRQRLRRGWRRNGIAYFFILPAFTFFILFIVYPLVDGLVLSLYRWDGLSARQFVGLRNFVGLLEAPNFYGAVKNTLQFTVVTTVAKIVIGFLLATALHFEIPGWKIFRAVFYLNVILPMTAVGVLWSAILNPHSGPLAAGLGLFDLDLPSLLGNPKLVMWVLSLIDIWKYSGFPMIFLYAAMEGIPQDLYEAAVLDGGSNLQKLWYVTLPLTKPVLLTITLLQTIFSFQVFDIVFTMTKGGPGYASEVLTHYLYQEGFWFLRFGSASATAVLLLLIILLFSTLYIGQGGLRQREVEF